MQSSLRNVRQAVRPRNTGRAHDHEHVSTPRPGIPYAGDITAQRHRRAPASPEARGFRPAGEGTSTGESSRRFSDERHAAHSGACALAPCRRNQHRLSLRGRDGPGALSEHAGRRRNRGCESCRRGPERGACTRLLPGFPLGG